MAPTPGILWNAAKIANKELTAETLTRWYDEVHFPDILKTSGMKTTLRYQALDPTVERPFFYYYPLRDLAFVQSEEFLTIPLTSDLLPGPSHNIFSLADFDVRFYELVQDYEPEGTKAGPGTLLISVAMTPAPGTDGDFDAWYRQEHLSIVSKCTGYRRTRRFKLATAMQTAMLAKMRTEAEEGEEGEQGPSLPPAWLALHEFDGQMLPAEELKETAETEWARKVMGGLAAYEVGVYRFVTGKGEMERMF